MCIHIYIHTFHQDLDVILILTIHKGGFAIRSIGVDIKKVSISILHHLEVRFQSLSYNPRQETVELAKLEVHHGDTLLLLLEQIHLTLKLYKLDVDLQVSFSHFVICDNIRALSQFSEVYTQLSTKAKYSKLRPTISVTLDPKQWWQFAIQAVIEDNRKTRVVDCGEEPTDEEYCTYSTSTLAHSIAKKGMFCILLIFLLILIEDTLSLTCCG